MAVTLRGGTPAVAATTANPVSLTLTGTRQPQPGDVLLIIHGNDFYGLANMPTPTVGGSTAGVTAITNGTADAGANGAHVKAYYRVVSATGDLTVSVTETGSADEDKVLVAYVLSGVDTASPVDGGAAGAAGTGTTASQTVQPAPSVAPAGTDALLVVHNNSGGGGSTSGYTPPPSPYAELYDAQVGGISYCGGTEQLSAAGPTGTRTITAANSVSWAAVSVAVKTGAVGPAVGTADVGLALGLAATGSRGSAGAAGADLGLEVAAEGSRRSAGAAPLGVVFDLAASGSARHTGRADLELALAVAAAGPAPPGGSSSLAPLAGPAAHGDGHHAPTGSGAFRAAAKSTGR